MADAFSSSLMHDKSNGSFHPTVWDTHDIISSSTSDDQEKVCAMEDDIRIKQLKKEVHTMLSLSANDPLNELNLINTIQRLGLGYHFEDEIEHILEGIYNGGTHFLLENDGADLYFTSLWFRLLRQAGYHVSIDLFSKFIDEKGEFLTILATDVQGMLSLYEASYLGFNGEKIMDEALTFTTKQLNSMLPHLSPSLALEVEYALKLPIQQSVERVHARQYITIYEQAESPNQTLLEFAKLDFNALQLLYRKELNKLTRWYEAVDIKSKLPYETRDRIVESYALTSSTFFEPQFSLGRIHLAKLWAAFTVLDDAYDVYADLCELGPLTDALQRWDSEGVNGLSEPMKAVFLYMINLVDEIEGDMIKLGHTIGVPYLKKEIQNFTNGQFEEAKLAASVDPPTLDKWLPISLTATGLGAFLVAAVMHLDDLATKEVFDWTASMPKMLHCNYMISRIMDDIGAPKDVPGTAISTVTCYMKEHGVSELEAIEALEGMLPSLWKDINKENLKSDHVPMRVFKSLINLTRIMTQFYSDKIDGFTTSHGRTQEIIATLLIDPIVV